MIYNWMPGLMDAFELVVSLCMFHCVWFLSAQCVYLLHSV